MTSTELRTLRVGAWRVEPRQGRMTRADDAVRLEPRMLRLLLCLAERPGELLNADDLARAVSPGAIVTPDSVYQAIASLRRLLGDDPKAPTYVVTEPRRGYRLIAPVFVEDKAGESAAALPQAADGESARASANGASGAALQGSAASQGAALGAGTFETFGTIRVPEPGPRFSVSGGWRLDRRNRALVALVGVLMLLALVGTVRRYAFPPAPPAVSPRAVAVMPFQDLTDSMGEEPFADGMTEELIDRLSKSGLRVPAPTAVNYYRDKALPVPDIARQLGVAYLLDGSVRKSGERLRIAARLMRADDGFVLWSETYERPRGDLLKVQDEIATAVAAALPAQIGGAERR